MNNWGSVPDWISVAIALFALIGFVIVERERLILGNKKSGGVKENNTLSESTENEKAGLTEDNVDIRAELYSRILIGIMFGLSLSPILNWITHNFFFHTTYDYAFEEYANSIIAIIFSTFLSIIFTFIYFRAYSKMTSVFVHWVERLIFSYLGFWLILTFFSYWTQERYSESELYIRTFSSANILTSVIILLLISFPSTPVDWIIHLVSKSREKNLPTQKTG